MTYARSPLGDDVHTIPRMPSWVTATRSDTLEDEAFSSGAALSHLHQVLGRDDVPRTLLRARLALRAAEICMAQAGRPERAGALRDAVAFLRPGDKPGPAGEVTLAWQRAVARPVSVAALRRALPDMEADAIARWSAVGQGAPVARAALVLEAVLADRPRDPTGAAILADAALAQAFGWDHVLPLLVLGLRRGDLRKTGAALRQACHRALAAAAVDAVREAADLARRGARLTAVAPTLRAKGAAAAVTVFLIREAVAPTDLTSLRSDRAARRFCDRLVALGAVRELTGRETFRLYGV